jgi:hypothetical protein
MPSPEKSEVNEDNETLSSTLSDTVSDWARVNLPLRPNPPLPLPLALVHPVNAIGVWDLVSAIVKGRKSCSPFSITDGFIRPSEAPLDRRAILAHLDRDAV